MGGPGRVALNAEGLCEMTRLNFPTERYRWSVAARPGGMSHINCEEASALVWSVHDRLRRRNEQGVRCLHLVDSTACAGAAKKGRSSSRSLNARMRQLCAVCVVGQIEAFIGWVPSGSTPSDAPSSVYGIRAGRKSQPPAARIQTFQDDAGVALWDLGGVLKPTHFLLVVGMNCFVDCDALRKEVECALEDVAFEAAVVCIPTMRRSATGFDDQMMSWASAIVCQGRCCGLIAAPPAGTWSCLRQRTTQRLGRAAPLRRRGDPFGVPSQASSHERVRCEAENRALWGCMHLALLGRAHATWFVLCHPGDRGPPHPSFFVSSEFLWFSREAHASTADMDLCMYGADSRRRVTLCSNDGMFMDDVRMNERSRCGHKLGHRRPATVWGRAPPACFALPVPALRLCVAALACSHGAQP